jgi:hypothetical protein
LKRSTALGALTRFVNEARAAITTAPVAAGAADDHARALAAEETALAGALAAERVRLRARLEASFRRAAAEVLELMRPAAWPFGERRPEPADREFLVDLLEDAIIEAAAASEREVQKAAAAGGREDLKIAETISRFVAYARGALHGEVDRFFRDQLGGGGRPDLAQLERALAAAVPDCERELFAPLGAAIATAHARARAALAEADARRSMLRLVHEERVLGPVGALGDAVAALAGQS